MISFVGAGPGAPDLITLRGAQRLARAEVVVWASSLVPDALLDHCPQAQVHDSATMTLEDVLAVYAAHPDTTPVVRLHSGDPSVDGAIGEQIFTPADILVLAQNAMHVRAGRSNRLYVLVNGELHPSFKLVEPRLITIVNRSFSTLLKRGLNADVQRAYADARRSGIDFNLTFIEPWFRPSPDEPFDVGYRRELFEYGYRRALSGALWAKAPPGPID